MLVTCPSCGTHNRIPPPRLGDRARCGRCKTPLGPIDRPVAVDSDADFEALVAGARLPVLVDFWARWCGPCHMVAPELEKLARAKVGQVIVAKVDTEALPEVATRFGIRSIPTLILFRDGNEAQRVSGAMASDAIAQAIGL